MNILLNKIDAFNQVIGGVGPTDPPGAPRLGIFRFTCIFALQSAGPILLILFSFDEFYSSYADDIMELLTRLGGKITEFVSKADSLPRNPEGFIVLLH